MSGTARRRKAAASAPPSRRASGKAPGLIIWCSPTVDHVDRRLITEDLAKSAPSLGAPQWRGDLLAGAPTAAASIARARVADPKIGRSFLPASAGDLEVELAIDARPDLIPEAVLSGRMYDGEEVAKNVLDAIPPSDRTTHTVALWVTRRLLLTYSPDDYRYHARYAVFGYPAVFSLLGLVYAPAPSTEAALFAHALARRGWAGPAIGAEIDKQYPEERIDLDDRELVAHAIASTAMQAFARQTTGEPFCADGACRLSNPHRKPAVRESIGGQHLCAHHRKWLAGGAGRS